MDTELMPSRVDPKEIDLVALKQSDHNFLDTLVDTNIGKLHIYSLNLLTRQCINFRQTNIYDAVNARLNFPISWFHGTKNEALVLAKLQQEGKTMRFIEKTMSHPFEKQQLELIDISTGNPSRTLPSTIKMYIETEEEYFKRIFKLGVFVSEKMTAAIRIGETVIFAIQELQSDINSINAFMMGVNFHKNNTTSCYCIRPKEDSVYMTGLLYDKKQLLPLSGNIVYDEKIKKFENDFAKLLRGAQSTGHFAYLVTAAFKDLITEKIICASSVHADFGMVNQDIHQQNLMSKIAAMSQEYGIVIAGDFNRKIQHETEIHSLYKKILDESIEIKFMAKSTKPGLQLHDTMDAIFTPVIYPDIQRSLQHKLMTSFSIFKKMEDEFLTQNRHAHPKIQSEYDKKFGLVPLAMP